MNKHYEALKLENQLCFPLYACAKEIVRKYKPHLDKLDLTYTQYLVMMVMWDVKQINVKELGDKLYLDSGTLTPLLKKLEAKSYITRTRSKFDERNLVIEITEKGSSLRDQAVSIPKAVGACVNIDSEKATILYDTLYEILEYL
ncbi:MAG: MarR family transcriptional regulator [Ruminococcus sp.]|nr:MarR family transcriptional regulator [Ruminococcus sp.]